jgi:hypothetical protein
MMETLTTVLGWLGYAFAIIGFIGTVWKTINIWMSQKTFSWKDFDRQVKSIIRQMRKDGFYLDIIVSIGRGGAIVGATISGNLHHRKRKAPKDSENITILGCDRIYEWDALVRLSSRIGGDCPCHPGEKTPWITGKPPSMHGYT